MKQYTIRLTPLPNAPECLVTLNIPPSNDPEEYIDDYLDGILNDDARYNCEWDFAY